jgi:hypothetical protein
MAGLISADEIFEKAQNAAAAATGLDEKAMQIDYPALKEKIRAPWGIAKSRSASRSMSRPYDGFRLHRGLVDR